MSQPGLSTLNMSSANFGIPTPPANDTSDSKNPFFPNSDISGENSLNVTNSKTTKIISASHDINSETSSPSTPEPFTQSQSKSRYYITDPSILPSLVARIAESNNIKLPNYGDLSISSAPSVCDSVSSVPDLSDSASTPISPPDDDSSDSTTSSSSSSSSSSTDQSCMIPCTTTSSNSTSSASSSTSYSGRILQKISNTSSKSNNTKSKAIINDEKKNENNLGNPIVNAIVAASAAPRTLPIPNRTDRRSKRKGIPYKSPSHEDLLREPGFVFRFPIVFDNALPTNRNDNDDDKNKEINNNTNGESINNNLNKNLSESSQTGIKNKDNSINNNNNNNNVSQQQHNHHSNHHHHHAKPQLAKIIHRPLLLPDIVRKLSQARKNKMRTRPVTRAKNKKENQELDMFKLGYDQMIDSQINSSAAIEEAKARKRRVAAVGRPSKKLILPSSGSQVPRSSNSGENKSPRGSSICSTSSSSSAAAAAAAAAAYYRMPSSKRRDSMSVSSSLSIPPSELSDFDLNSDNFGDDEDDPDFAPPAKKRRSEVQRGSKTVGRKESNSKVKVCASCRTKSTPCWRPGWSTDLMLCNSCGLRLVLILVLNNILKKNCMY
jgi:hypothetical protein